MNSSSPVSALRRCRHPVPARVVLDHDRPVRVTTDRRGFGGGTVVHAAGPWRISGEWWDVVQAGQVGQGQGQVGRASGAFNRDEWDVALADGATYVVFRDRDTDRWFVDAIVD
jgi:hypothetical protein